MNEIHRDHLIPGELYFIECLTQIGNGEIIKNTNTKMMAGFFHHYEVINSYVGPWVSISMSWFPAKKLLKAKTISDVYAIPTYDVELNKLWRFYDVRRFKIQNAMETRALNKILKNVIGDEWIAWG